MKKLFLFLFILTMGSITIQAQKEMNSGYIKMEITEVGSDNEQVAMQLEMMKGSQTEIFFTEGKNLSKMSMMGGMVETTTLYTTEAAKTDVLMNMMGQKIHLETTDADAKAAAGGANPMADMDITYDESDSKMILGYKCIRADFKNKENPDMNISMYLTKDIKGSVKGMQMVGQLEFEGFPLQIMLEMPQMSMTMEAVELKDEVDADVFELKTGGYQKMTMEEFQKKMGAMGAQFGF